MSRTYADVVEFNKEIIKLDPVPYLNTERLEWFKTAINEELGEFEEANKKYKEAIDAPSLFKSKDMLLELNVDMIDAIMDLIYFALGRLYEIGVTQDDFDAMWDAIHTANMTKKRGNKGRGSDDDAIKPEGWQGPEQRFIDYKKGKQKQLDSCVETSKRVNEHIEKIRPMTPKELQCDCNICNITKDYPEGYIRACDYDAAGMPIINVQEGHRACDYDATGIPITNVHEHYRGTEIPKSPFIRFELPKDLEEHKPGMKYDKHKPNLSLVFGGFPRALLDVGEIGTFGARKYTPDGWKYVENLQERYSSALLRHMFSILNHDEFDKETGRHHLAHVAWNALALLEDKFHSGHIPYIRYNEEALAKSEETLRKYFEGKNNE